MSLDRLTISFQFLSVIGVAFFILKVEINQTSLVDVKAGPFLSFLCVCASLTKSEKKEKREKREKREKWQNIWADWINQ